MHPFNHGLEDSGSARDFCEQGEGIRMVDVDSYNDGSYGSQDRGKADFEFTGLEDDMETPFREGETGQKVKRRVASEGTIGRRS